MNVHSYFLTFLIFHSLDQMSSHLILGISQPYTRKGEGGKEEGEEKREEEKEEEKEEGMQEGGEGECVKEQGGTHPSIFFWRIKQTLPKPT